MDNKIKNGFDILLRLFKEDKINSDDFCELASLLVDKEKEVQYVPYQPLQPNNPWMPDTTPGLPYPWTTGPIYTTTDTKTESTTKAERQL